MNNKKKPVVAHIRRSSLFMKSETFIYHIISNLKQFHPICLAWRFVNLDQFPFPKDDLHSISFKRYTLKWLYYGILRNYCGRDPVAEEIIKKHKTRLIHAHFGISGIYALGLKRLLGIPLVTTFYGFDLSRFDIIKKWKRKYKILFQEGALFLVAGPFMKTRLIYLGCPEDKIQIQRNAIPVNKIPFIPHRPKGSKEKVILLFCGRFTEKKGLIYALKAINKLHGKYKNFEFRIIGDGALRSVFEEYIQINHMTDYIRLLGFLDYKNYLKEMQRGDIFIHPSITASNGDSEGGAPTTILEAQAMGMPIVSTYHADIPNIVIPGKSALLSQEKDIEKLSQNIAYLLENQHIWEKMGYAGRKFVDTYHNIEKEIVSLEDKYNFILQTTDS